MKKGEVFYGLEGDSGVPTPIGGHHKDLTQAKVKLKDSTAVKVGDKVSFYKKIGECTVQPAGLRLDFGDDKENADPEPTPAPAAEPTSSEPGNPADVKD